MKKYLVVGASGQDASFLSEILLEDEGEVYGLNRRTSTNNTYRLKNCLVNPNYHLIEGDVTDPASIYTIISLLKPDEIYALQAQSHVHTSFSQPILTWKTIAEGTLNILEAVRQFSPKSKVYIASSSEMFGSSVTTEVVDGIMQKFQDENTPFQARSPYAIAKVAAHMAGINYREAYGLFVCCGILHNHCSERRGENFFTRKVTKYIGQLVKNRNIPKLKLGNLSSVRDFGYAKDFVVAMRYMMHRNEPDDFMICTGVGHTVEEFLRKAFFYAGFDNYENYIEIDPSLFRPTEVDFLRGNYSKAKTILGWEPKTTFEELIRIMVENDLYENN